MSSLKGKFSQKSFYLFYTNEPTIIRASPVIWDECFWRSRYIRQSYFIARFSYRPHKTCSMYSSLHSIGSYFSPKERITQIKQAFWFFLGGGEKRRPMIFAFLRVFLVFFSLPRILSIILLRHSNHAIRLSVKAITSEPRFHRAHKIVH